MPVNLQCGGSTVKYLLFIFNLIFVLCGILLIALGAVALRSHVAASSSYNAGLGLVIAVGVIIFLVAFLGCCGAIQQNRIMLYAFAACLLVIILLELIGAILVLANYDDNALNQELTRIFVNALDKQNTDDIASADSIQSTFSCCGLLSYQNWLRTTLPDSCCETAYSGGCTSPYAYQDGCLKQVDNFVSQFGKAVGGVGIAVLFVEIAGVALSIYLAKKL